MSLQVIMASDYQILCLGENDSLKLSFLTNHIPPEKLIYAYQYAGEWFLRTKETVPRWYDLRTQTFSEIMPLNGIGLIAHSLNIFNLKVDDQYLYVDWDGKVKLSSSSKEDSALFRLIDSKKFEIFLKQISYRWVRGTKGDIVSINLHTSSLREINIGSAKIGFDQLFEALIESQKTGELLVNEEWKVWRFVRYNPLIILEAYGPDAVDELSVALCSLKDFAGYRDKVFILTDANHRLLEEKFCDIGLSLQFFYVSPQEAQSSPLPRARLIKNPQFLDQYAPILFCSSGVVFGAPLDKLMTKVALSRQVEGLEYFFHPESPSSETEQKRAQNLLIGEGGSLMMVPNMAHHRIYLEAAFDLLERLIKEFGLKNLPQERQPLINYALRRVRDFSTQYFSRTVLATRFVPSFYGVISEIICFPISEEKRSAQMKTYLETIKKAEGEIG
ncbi:hypothetical protein [Aristophania vespae]|uniref:hypothetical protein n=1 Tax=Aristophania vespae TaxID=2697033 RepID=UPI0023519E64|nr:hypothetical protein [Aristophania vespae]UMM63469.1 hypothetical protein DM15PD_04360 [Aristophania vespae]